MWRWAPSSATPMSGASRCAAQPPAAQEATPRQGAQTCRSMELLCKQRMVSSQEAFVPERWIDGAAEAANEVERSAWMAFGDGAPLRGLSKVYSTSPANGIQSRQNVCTSCNELDEGCPSPERRAAGARSCIGKRFAEVEAKIAIIRLYQKCAKRLIHSAADHALAGAVWHPPDLRNLQWLLALTGGRAGSLTQHKHAHRLPCLELPRSRAATGHSPGVVL